MKKTPPPWLPYLSWLPVVIYFGVKYYVIGADQLTGRQNLYLIGAFILAEVALWQYRRQFNKKANNEEDHGTD